MCIIIVSIKIYYILNDLSLNDKEQNLDNQPRHWISPKDITFYLTFEHSRDSITGVVE